MIYITDAKGDGRPCLKVYEGKVIKWYYCKSEEDLFSPFINLLNMIKILEFITSTEKRYIFLTIQRCLRLKRN